MNAYVSFWMFSGTPILLRPNLFQTYGGIQEFGGHYFLKIVPVRT